MEVIANDVQVKRVLTSQDTYVSGNEHATAKELITIYLVTFACSLFACKVLSAIAGAL